MKRILSILLVSQLLALQAFGVVSLTSDGKGTPITSHTGALDIYLTNPAAGSNPAAGNTGAAVPSLASYTGVNNGSGNLVGLSYGQALMAASLPVTLSSNQSALPVTGTFWQTTQPISGTITANIGTSGSLALNSSVTGLQVAQGSTTSGQSGSLTLGAVTTAAPTYVTAQTSPFSLTTAGALRVDGSGVTQPVSAASLPLPTGASTSALQTQISGQLPSTLGAKTTANSMSVNVASDQVVNTADAANGSVTGGTAGTKTELMGGIFNTVLPTLTTGQQAAIQVDSSGRQIMGTSAATIGAVGINAGTNLIGKVGIDQTTPGTTNGVQVNAALPTGANTIGAVNIAAAQTLSTVTTVGAVTAITNALPAGANLMGKVGIDQTTVGTTNGVSLAQIGANTVLTGNGVSGTGSQRVNIASDNTAFGVKITDGTNTGTVKAASTAAVAADTATVVAISPNNSVQTKAPLTATGSGSAAAATVSTVITSSAPANAVGFVLQNLDTSTANIRWAVGRTATATLGQQLQPGRDTGFVPIGASVSIVAESGTQNYDIQWIAQ